MLEHFSHEARINFHAESPENQTIEECGFAQNFLVEQTPFQLRSFKLYTNSVSPRIRSISLKRLIFFLVRAPYDLWKPAVSGHRADKLISESWISIA